MYNSGNKITIVLVCAVMAFFALFHTAQATTLEVVPPSSSRSVGETFSVSVFVGTSGSPINAVSGALIFPQDKLQFVSVAKEGSIISIWPQEPAYRDLGDSGSVQFEGVVLGGFSAQKGKIVTVTFRAKAAGSAALRLSEASVLANDGQGTNLLATLVPGSVTISQKPVAVDALRITSDTHPNQDEWYSKNKASFSWNIPKGAVAIAKVLDQKPDTVPTESETLTTALKTGELTDGVWYLHVRYKNAQGVFSATTHYKIQVDTVKPDRLIVQEIERGKDNAVGTRRFLFDAADSLSGIKKFEVHIDNTLIETLDAKKENIYELKDLEPGNHTLIIEAYDGAGNFIVNEKSLTIAGFEAPTITYYQKRITPESYLVLKGTTEANAKVMLYDAPYTRALFGSDPVTFFRNNSSYGTLLGTVVSDENGDFFFVSKDFLSRGRHAIRAVAVNTNGIQSEASDAVYVMSSVIYSPSVVASIIILFFALLIAVAAFIIIRKHKKHGVLEDKVAMHQIKGVIQALNDDLKERVHQIDEKIKKGERMTSEDKELLVLLSKEFMEHNE